MPSSPDVRTWPEDALRAELRHWECEVRRLEVLVDRLKRRIEWQAESPETGEAMAASRETERAALRKALAEIDIACAQVEEFAVVLAERSVV
jgi:hypothetical protein